MSRRARRVARDRAEKSVRKRRGQDADPEITLSEEDGVRYLHFGNEWVQGALTIRRPWELALDYSRHMMAWLLFYDEQPDRILQLGLGTGSLTHFAHHHFANTQITAVDNSEAVVRAARTHFKLPPDDERLETVVEDGEVFVNQTHRHGWFDIVQVDVFDADVRGPVLNSLAFYQACRRVLTPSGMMVVNLFGEVASYQDNMTRILAAFDNRSLVLPPVEAGNVIVLASNSPVSPEWPELYQRAERIEQLYNLPASGFVNGLKHSVATGLSRL